MTLDKTIRYKIYTMFYDGATERQIARDCKTSEKHVSDVIKDFRKAERITAKARRDGIIFDDELGVKKWLDNNKTGVSNFVLMSDNYDVLNAYNRMINP